jgi:sulfur carrier protein
MSGMVRINRELRPLEAATLAELLTKLGMPPGTRGVAVALNGAVVRAAAWNETALNPDDEIEIIHARQGG